MKTRDVNRILRETEYKRISGRESELKAAEYLKAECEKLGAKAWLEPFATQLTDMKEAHLYADGKEIPCEGFNLCGSGEIEAPLYYMPNKDKVSLAGAKGKIVMLDQPGMQYFLYQDLLKAGAVGFITRCGDVNYRDRDIARNELRPYVSNGNKILGVTINVKDQVEMIRKNTQNVKLVVKQDEFMGESRDVVAEVPGQTDEWIVVTAHYDTTFLSVGSYDNMTGCIAMLAMLEAALETAPNRYGVRFVFCGSEERGLLGSKAYVAAHESELDKIALNINIDMVGTILGKFIACVSAEDKLVSYIEYFASEMGWGIEARSGVYSSDSTPFADKGVPALSFARLAGGSVAPIHNRYDTPAVLSAEQILKDSAFMAAFLGRMANSVMCPVGREIPQSVKDELDKYLNRKR